MHNSGTTPDDNIDYNSKCSYGSWLPKFVPIDKPTLEKKPTGTSAPMLHSLNTHVYKGNPRNGYSFTNF